MSLIIVCVRLFKLILSLSKTRSLYPILSIFLTCLLYAVPVNAQEEADEANPENTDAPSSKEDDLARQIAILAEELEKIRSGETEEELTEEESRALGVAPSASKVYSREEQGVSIAGYGEVLLENYAANNQAGVGGGPVSKFDALRAIIYTGYRFNDKIVFNSEIEIEHAKEAYLEFAYVDYNVTDNLTLRGGLLLIPLGLVNEFHEPNVFIGAKRPVTEQVIIPSTWRENGGGVLGNFGPVSFRAYIVNGMNGTKFSSSGFRGGRQKGGKAKAGDMAFAGRLDVTPTPGVFAGVGIYRGGSDQGQVKDSNGNEISMGTTIVEVHGQAQVRGIDIRGLFAQASVDNAGVASTALGLSSGSPIADTLRGGYLQVGYNLLSQVDSPIASLMPYVRIETVDTQYRVPTGFTRDLKRDGTYKTFGMELKPINNVALKAEYAVIINTLGSGRNQFNLNLGYAF
jgi:hypothetical protein